MKRVHHVGGSLLTGDDIADALIDLAREAAERGTVLAVEIPVHDQHGRGTRAQVLVGPGMQLVSIGAGHDDAEIVEPETVRMLRSRAENTALPFAPSDVWTYDYDDFDG
jgi:hypothetical protein